MLTCEVVSGKETVYAFEKDVNVERIALFEEGLGKLSKKICLVLVEPKGYERPYALECKRKLIDMLKGEGFLGQNTLVEFKSLSGGSKTFELYTYEYFQTLTLTYIIEALIEAEKEGYDAATVACCLDSGIQQARGILEMPVVGIMESVFAAAHAMGARRRSVGMITMNKNDLPKTDAIIDQYGFRPCMLPVKPVRDIPTEIYLNASTLLDKKNIEEAKAAYVRAARELVKDGAQLLITACGGLGPLMAINGIDEVEGVPVLDPITAGLKMAEVVVDYRKQGSYKGKRSGLTEGDLKRGRSYFGLSSS